ncbi:MAG TPA: hypothetical protein VH092_02165 [Urbifossiella sp.]|nr:hypothetical protein [Urbifossiella sp.]
MPSLRPAARAARPRNPVCPGDLAAALPGLRGLATVLAGGDPHRADDLLSHLFYQCVLGWYDPTRGSLPTWGGRVMANHRVTLARGRRPGAGAADDRPDPTDPFGDMVGYDLLTAPFPPGDAAIVRGWPSVPRAVLLVRGLLWQKVAAGDWEEMRSAAGLPSGFPGLAFLDLLPADRHADLAAALGRQVNSVHQIWRRWRPCLDQLRFVRGLDPAA